MINELHSPSPRLNHLTITQNLIDTNKPENYPIIGHSAAIKKVKKQIEFASELVYVIFISGEHGCEKTTVAWHIHHLSSDKPGKFITIPANINNSTSYKDNLLKSIVLAKNGTLYIEDVDDLSSEKKDELIFLFALEDFSKKLKENNIRLIISCVEPLFIQEHRQFIAELMGPVTPQFNFHLPPLRERIEDITDHIGFILSGLQANIDVTDSALALLHQYNWPGNIVELQRLILFLASYCDEEITEKDILSLGIIDNTLQFSQQNIVDKILSQNLECFKCMHAGIYKALLFLSQHYLDEISLDQLASSAYTSPSHLSYLFRKYLHMPFKTLLNHTRIHFAKLKIDASPVTSITDICMQSGFSDLSHFEKMFKRYIGCTPRQYRTKQRKRNETFLY